MNNIKHTPPPWKVIENGFESVMSDIRDSDDNVIAQTFGRKGEIEANARLIAAAPELLMVCKELQEYLAEDIGILNAVIKKAEGESS